MTKVIEVLVLSCLARGRLECQHICPDLFIHCVHTVCSSVYHFVHCVFIVNAQLPECTKHPILLDKKHHFTLLVVRDCHSRVMHNGVKETFTELRSRYWIVQGRQFVRRLLYECKICRRQANNMTRPSYNNDTLNTPRSPLAEKNETQVCL